MVSAVNQSRPVTLKQANSSQTNARRPVIRISAKIAVVVIAPRNIPLPTEPFFSSPFKQKLSHKYHLGKQEAMCSCQNRFPRIVCSGSPVSEKNPSRHLGE